MAGDMLLLCDECSQLFTIRLEGELNLAPPKFCPCCGTASLRKVKSAIAACLKGACFADINPQLVLLLYSQWAQERAGGPHPSHERFVDYVTGLIAGQ